jgi:DNA polymerase III subunit delta'
MPFRDVVGNRRLVGLLARSVAHSSLPPSLIFAGPSGVGKRLAATALAQALNCVNEPIGTRHPAPSTQHPAPSTRHPAPGTWHPAPGTWHPAPGTWHPTPGTSPEPPLESDACGTCPTCARIARGVHPDVLAIEPGDTGSIKIDEIREMVDRASFRPFEGRRRVVIIDQADALVVPAQNALLKTLEEPPSASVFVLITARPDVLLPTVRSRCPVLRFRPLNAADIAAALVTRGATEREARAVAATADGSLGRALQASAGDLVEAREVARRVLMHAAGARDAARRIDGAKDLIAKSGGSAAIDRELLASNLRAMASLLRDVEVLATRADERTLANADVRADLDTLAGAYGGERGTRAFAAVDKALVAVQRNAGVKIVADWLVLNL